MFALNGAKRNPGWLVRLFVAAVLAMTAGCDSEISPDSPPDPLPLPLPRQPVEAAKNQLVLKLVTSDSGEESGGAPAPYSSENYSQVILIATITEPTEQQTRDKELPLDIEEVLRGNSFVEKGEVVVKDSPNWHLYACVEIPPGATHFSDQFAPGSSVGVFLRQDPEHSWRVADMLSLETQPPHEVKAAWRKRIQRFVSVAEAAKADDPEARYEELLPGQPLDESTFYALAYNRHPAAVPHIRQWLIDLSGMREGERKTSGHNFRDLMELLGNHHDAASIGPAATTAAQLKVGERYSFFEFLPMLCRDADKKTLAELREVIVPMLKELPPESELDRATKYALAHEFHAGQAALKFLNEQLEPE